VSDGWGWLLCIAIFCVGCAGAMHLFSEMVADRVVKRFKERGVEPKPERKP
jgi:hypothetical protein